MKVHLLYCEFCDMHFRYGNKIELETHRQKEHKTSKTLENNLFIFSICEAVEDFDEWDDGHMYVEELLEHLELAHQIKK